MKKNIRLSYLYKRATDFFGNKSHVRRHDRPPVIYTGAQAPESGNDSTAGTQQGERGNTGTRHEGTLGIF